MCNKSQYELALSFWRVSFEYLMLVENVARETVAQGNTWFITKRWQDGPVTEKEYRERARWSDYTIIIPLLFNLYHGIELLVKGFLLVTPQTDVKPTHTVQRLCRQFYNAYPGENELNGFLRKYTEEGNLPAILCEFLHDNAVTFNDLYQALRYPSDRDFQSLNKYIELKYKGDQGIPFFKELHEDIEAIRIAAVRLGRSLEPKE
jgi:hypothetical protein